MESNPNHRYRILQELVSLEAWHKPLKLDQKSPFHVAVGFGDARYSGGDRSPVSFRVKLKRATLVVVCDPGLQVPKRTKVREHPEWSKAIKQTVGEKLGLSIVDTSGEEVELKAALTSGPSASAKGSHGKSASEEKEQAQGHEISQVISQHIQMNYREVGEEHHWDCTPISTEALQGTAHSGKDFLMELSPNVVRGVENLGIRVYVKCRSEDFEVHDIKATPTVVERFTGEKLDRRLALAKEVIKQKLAEARLEIADLDSDFAEVVVADILATPE